MPRIGRARLKGVNMFRLPLYLKAHLSYKGGEGFNAQIPCSETTLANDWACTVHA